MREDLSLFGDELSNAKALYTAGYVRRSASLVATVFSLTTAPFSIVYQVIGQVRRLSCPYRSSAV